VALSAPGTASVSGIAAGSGAKAPRRRAIVTQPRPRASRIRGYEPRSTPHPAPPSGSSPETPLDERDFRTMARSHYVVNSVVDM
jgi:hypothetical protein